MKLLYMLALVWAASPLMARDTLSIISPHRMSIQQEFVPAFQAYYKKTYEKEVNVEWIDQGGTSDDVRFIRARFANNPETIGIDLFWGGGSAVYADLAREGWLASYELPESLQKEVPTAAAGISLYGYNNTWYGSAMSSFGIFYNKPLLRIYKLPEPETWSDLAKPIYQGNISLTDPRRSGTANTMNSIILQSMGWEKGWELLTSIAGNTRSFTHASADPIKAVISGDAAIAMVIDFYAMTQIAELGVNNLGFVMPPGQTVLDPDPVAILKGAPNRKVAERFVNFILSADAQKLLVLPQGVEEGPRFSTLGRMAVNTKTYELTENRRLIEFNPFAQESFLQIDLDQAARLQRVFNDMVGALLIDTHKELKDGWDDLIKSGKAGDEKEIAKFGKPPVTEEEFNELVEKWGDEVFRNRTINQWVQFAKNKYGSFK